uniref:LITAF domain-containing protein n=1 Tax=Mesocestoides corti TaxID=53468 RepID=A0A5K3F1A2_MESCO
APTSVSELGGSESDRNSERPAIHTPVHVYETSGTLGCANTHTKSRTREEFEQRMAVCTNCDTPLGPLRYITTFQLLGSARLSTRDRMQAQTHLSYIICCCVCVCVCVRGRCSDQPQGGLARPRPRRRCLASSTTTTAAAAARGCHKAFPCVCAHVNGRTHTHTHIHADAIVQTFFRHVVCMTFVQR